MEFSAAWIRFQYAMKKADPPCGGAAFGQPNVGCRALADLLRPPNAFELSLGVQQRLREVVRQLLEVGRVQLELFGPGGLVDAGHCGELLGAEVQTRPVDLGILGATPNMVSWPWAWPSMRSIIHLSTRMLSP